MINLALLNPLILKKDVTMRSSKNAITRSFCSYQNNAKPSCGDKLFKYHEPLI